jgi:ABC-2 type transport system ATP-binding protein
VREMLLRDETLHGLEVSAPALEDAFLALTSSAAKTN